MVVLIGPPSGEPADSVVQTELTKTADELNKAAAGTPAGEPSPESAKPPEQKQA